MDRVINAELVGYLNSGRIPHGFLFCGGDKTLEAAVWLSSVYLCEKKGTEPCGECSPCFKTRNSVHPDLIMVKALMPDGKYKVDALRRVVSDGYLRPNDGELRVYIFEELSEMPPICQNSLLKFIEEPSDFNRFIFTAKSISGVLETITSRLVKVDFLTETDYANIDESVIGQVKKIIDGLCEKNEYKIASAFSSLADREKQKIALALIASVLRDSLIYKHGGNLQECSESCYGEGAAALAKVTSVKHLVAAAERIDGFLQKAVFNPNVRLAAAVYSSGIYSAVDEERII